MLLFNDNYLKLNNMGIKHFFMWYKNNMKSTMHSFAKHTTLKDKNISIDNLLLDLNGNIHNSAQKIFKYGNHAPPKRFLSNKQLVVVNNNQQTRNRLYQDVCHDIENLLKVVDPKKRLLLCIDGPAPLGKQNQQRQRRFRAASESKGGEVFDSNCITPGTTFMDELSIYIDSYIVKRKQESEKWQQIEVIFSDEKVPGEGEHKAVEFVRNHGTDEESYCINGPDADLFMLALATHKPNFYILREDSFDPLNEFFCVDVNQTRKSLIEKLKWENDNYQFNERHAINDFVFMCFAVGNDFLPHVPSIEIIENGVEMMIEIYKNTGKQVGHITTINSKGKVSINKDALYSFFTTIGQCELENFENKLSSKVNFFPDQIMLNHSHRDEKGKWHLDLESYTHEYNEVHFEKDSWQQQERVCHQYIQGLQWVITYYTTGCPSWNWYYPYQYAPMAKTISEHIKTYSSPRYGVTKPSLPFQQLLSVLPPKSSRLLPNPLNKCLNDKQSKMARFCPDKITIDLAGKRREWEGITIIPMVDQKIVKEICKKNIQLVDEIDLKRNISHNSKKY